MKRTRYKRTHTCKNGRHSARASLQRQFILHALETEDRRITKRPEPLASDMKGRNSTASTSTNRLPTDRHPSAAVGLDAMRPVDGPHTAASTEHRQCKRWSIPTSDGGVWARALAPTALLNPYNAPGAATTQLARGAAPGRVAAHTNTPQMPALDGRLPARRTSGTGRLCGTANILRLH